MEQNSTKTNINWYPGHMAKTKREIKENIDLIDIVYEVIDARIPKSSKNRDIDALIKNKPRIEDVELKGNKTFEELGAICLSNLEIEKLLNAQI